MMRRKSERNKGKSPENKVEKPKRGRPSRRRKKSSSSSPERTSASEDVVAETQETVEVEVTLPLTTSTVEVPAPANVPSDDEDTEQVWHVKASESSGDTGEIQKFKICLSRPSSTPERPDRSPRGRKKLNRTSQLEFSSESSEDKRKTRHRSRRGSTKELNSEENISSDNAEKDTHTSDEPVIPMEQSESLDTTANLIPASSIDDGVANKEEEKHNIPNSGSQMQTEGAKIEGENISKSSELTSPIPENILPSKESIVNTEQTKCEIPNSKESINEIPGCDKSITESSNNEIAHGSNTDSSKIVISTRDTSDVAISNKEAPSSTVVCIDISNTATSNKDTSTTLILNSELSDKHLPNKSISVNDTANSEASNVVLRDNGTTPVVKMDDEKSVKVITASETAGKETTVSEKSNKESSEVDSLPIVSAEIHGEKPKIAEVLQTKQAGKIVDLKPLQQTMNTSVESDNIFNLEASKRAGSEEETHKSNNSDKLDATVEVLPMQETIVDFTPTGNVRKRKWGSRSSKVTKTSTLSISTDSLKNLIPHVEPVSVEDVLMDVKPKENYETKSDKIKIDDDQRKSNGKYGAHEKKREKEILGSMSHRKISIVSEEIPKEQRPPSPPKYKASSILYITNLVRPFTLPQLKNLLQRTGKIVENGFWIDKIKSRCYVQYQSEDEASETRHALHGVTWPVSNPKTLNVDFGSAADMREALASGEEEKPVSHPDTRPKEQHMRDNKLSGKENDEKLFEKRTVVREWDVGKGDGRDERLGRQQQMAGHHSLQGERRKRRSKSPSPARKFKKKEEEAPSKLLDDLFKKTKATPCIYWLPLNAETILIKEEQRRKHMAEHERRMEELRRAAEEQRVSRNTPHHSSNHRHR